MSETTKPRDAIAAAKFLLGYVDEFNSESAIHVADAHQIVLCLRNLVTLGGDLGLLVSHVETMRLWEPGTPEHQSAAIRAYEIAEDLA